MLLTQKKKKKSCIIFFGVLTKTASTVQLCFYGIGPFSQVLSHVLKTLILLNVQTSGFKNKEVLFQFGNEVVCSAVSNNHCRYYSDIIHWRSKLIMVQVCTVIVLYLAFETILLLKNATSFLASFFYL